MTSTCSRPPGRTSSRCRILWQRGRDHRDGLAETLKGVECVIAVTSGPSPDQETAAEFFTTAARNLHEAGEHAGVRRMIVTSSIGCARFTAGYMAEKVAHERAVL